ncbi:MAG: cobalamin-binding protein [Chloroflexi bacterium]|nr:cobalamin-binding protein [Chloroflexota bacterium]
MKIKVLSIFLVLSIVLTGCGLTALKEPPISVGDGLDRQIQLDAPAARIISLSPPITEMLFAIGAGAQVVARDSFSDYPAEALDLPDIGGGFSEYDLETIIALDPDLVIAGSIQTPELVQSLEELGLTVFYLANPVDLEGMLDAIRTLGKISAHNSEAEDLIAKLAARIQAVDEALENITPVTIFYELDATDPAKPYTPGPGSFYSHLIGRAGGENIGDQLDTEWAQAGLEFILVNDPKFILLGDAMWGTTPESVAARPGWEALTAVREGRVLPFDDNLLARIGPRQVEGLEALAKIFHPEVFE